MGARPMILNGRALRRRRAFFPSLPELAFQVQEDNAMAAGDLPDTIWSFLQNQSEKGHFQAIGHSCNYACHSHGKNLD
jgi:hypothetical protein